MARPRNRIDTAEVTIRTTPQVADYLDALVESGLYGKTRAEAAERLVARGVEEELERGVIERRRASMGQTVECARTG